MDTTQLEHLVRMTHDAKDDLGVLSMKKTISEYNQK